MTLGTIQSLADSAKITLKLDGENIVLEGPESDVDKLAVMVLTWKPELVQVLQQRIIEDVGTCDCGTALLGLPTFDGFVNRVCPDCGRWCRCQRLDDKPESSNSRQLALQSFDDDLGKQ